MHENHKIAAPVSQYVSTQRCEVKTLDSIDHPYLLENLPTFLKIDTQGFEFDVLDGGRAILGRVAGAQIELSLVELYAGQMLFDQMLEYLANYGLHLWSVVPGFKSPKSGRMLQMDGVFFRGDV